MCNLEVETAKQILTLNTSKRDKTYKEITQPNLIYNNITWHSSENFL